MPNNGTDWKGEEAGAPRVSWPGQGEAMASALAGRDTVAVLPPTSDRPGISQLVGRSLPSPTLVVVSTRLAGQDGTGTDREGETREGPAVTAFDQRSAAHRIGGVQPAEHAGLLFLEPQQLDNAEIMRKLKAVKPRLVIVDQAQRISQREPDFQSEYERLSSALDALDRPTVLALTMSVSPLVRKEVVAKLGLRDPQIVIRGFDRPNLRLGVERFYEEREQRRALIERVFRAGKPGIVYVSTRKQAEEIAMGLKRRGVEAAACHGELDKAERERIAGASPEAAGRVQVVVATRDVPAFAPRPGVGFVFHYGLTDSVDSYYEEISQARGDGEPADATIFHRPEEAGGQLVLAGSGRLEIGGPGNAAWRPWNQEGPRSLTGLDDRAADLTGAALTGDAPAPGPEALSPSLGGEANDQPGRLTGQGEDRERVIEGTRTEMMRGYAATAQCRWAYLLDYFGEEHATTCGHCDNCEVGRSGRGQLSVSFPFPARSRVTHSVWGDGDVLRYEDRSMMVLFDSVGYRSLDVDTVVAGGLLRAADAVHLDSTGMRILRETSC